MIVVGGGDNDFLTDRRRVRLADVAGSRQQGCVVLEDISDPHNAMAVLRTCDAFGVQTVHMVYERQEGFDPRKLGKATSSSANKWVDVVRWTSSRACLEHLAAEGYQRVATALGDGAETLFEADLAAPRTALMFGNEHAGLSDSALALADRRIIVPMAGMVQSLNLSVTAALCLYEMTRQRRARGVADYRLDDDSRAALLARWRQF